VAGASKERIDRLLVEKKIAPTITQARALIMAGQVIADDHLIDKPGLCISPQAHIRLKSSPPPYAGRGGTKLEKPLSAFAISLNGKTVLDVGASTGGFTDCVLQKGAALVYAVDVGYGQLAWKLQQDPRVVRLDRTNIMRISPHELDPAPDLALIDASFTSLQRLLPHVVTLLAGKGEMLCLIKPQFEVKKGFVEKGGIVRDERQYQRVISHVVEACKGLGLHVTGIIESPVGGRHGNREFFIYANKKKY